MGVYRRFISEGPLTSEEAAAAATATKLVTPTNMFTASRPCLAGIRTFHEHSTKLHLALDVRCNARREELAFAHAGLS